MKRQKSGNPISDRCNPACMSGEAPAIASEIKANPSWIMTATPGQHKTRMRGRHVTRKEQIKPGG